MKRVKHFLIASVGALFLYILSIGPVIGILLRMEVDHHDAELIMQVYQPLGYLSAVNPSFKDFMKWYTGLFASFEEDDAGDPSPNPA